MEPQNTLRDTLEASFDAVNESPEVVTSDAPAIEETAEQSAARLSSRWKHSNPRSLGRNARLRGKRITGSIGTS